MKFQRDSNRAYLTIRDRIGQNLSSLQEGITGVRVIQAFAREQAVARFNESNRSLYDAHMESVRISVWYLPIVEFAGIAPTAAVVGIGGWLVHQGEVSLGTVVAFVLLLTNLFEPVQQLSQLFNTVQAAAAGSTSCSASSTPRPICPSARMRSTCPSTARSTSTACGSPTHGEDERVLRDVDLTIAPANAWRSSDRPAPASRRSRSWSPASTTRPQGSITFGGVDLRDATARSLRDRIVVVPAGGVPVQRLDSRQRAHRPLRRDRRGGRCRPRSSSVPTSASPSLPDGHETEVRERGSRLSAGERQLVSLARAALADPAVLVLDEATSSLDPGTEAMVERAMDRLMAGRTVIVIAHRLSTAERADRVGVVDHHDLVELGSHAELLAQGGRYAALYGSWAGSAPR